MLIIGSHVSFGKTQLLGATQEAISYGSNTFMFYTGAPQNTKRSPINDDLTYKAYELMKENNIDLKHYEEIASSCAHKGEIPIYVSNDKEVLGVISLSDQIKPTSKEAISKMKKLTKKAIK